MKLQNLFSVVVKGFAKPNTKAVLKMLVIFCLVGVSTHIFAEDLLKGTETNLIDSMNVYDARWRLIYLGRPLPN